MTETVDALARMLEAGKFEPYIRYIRFPHFRNLQDGLKIEFQYPITALVGPNGTNKTAILRALQGCPDYFNLGQYWFSTDVDPIKSEDRHRFIYGYKAQSVGEVVEVIKTRIARRLNPKTSRLNPDYFEPSRPLLEDGMVRPPKLKDDEEVPAERAATRWRAIKKPVLYLDFRSELSAYDKYFFHVPFSVRIGNLAAKKALIRRRSVHLARALRLGTKSQVLYRRQRIIWPVVELDSAQVSAISEILGRDYDSVSFLSHRYFDVEGSSVVLRVRGLQYSEAFAGSGEFAVSLLVKAVTEAEDFSLVLLDEPETSLHPGAQGKLVEFLFEQAKRKRLQIVMSTHAPDIVRGLPAKAIKVLQASPSLGKVELVSQESNHAEAFFRLGAHNDNTYSIFVEDALSEAIIRHALIPLGEATNRIIRISPLPGGAGSIRTRFIPLLAQADTVKCLVFLDGDQRPDSEVARAEDVPDGGLEAVLNSILGGKPQMLIDGGVGTEANFKRQVDQRRKILSWALANVAYLPGKDPESLVLSLEDSSLSENLDSSDAKAVWDDRSRKSLGQPDWGNVSADDIMGEQRRVLARVSQDAPELVEVRARVEKFLGWDEEEQRQ